MPVVMGALVTLGKTLSPTIGAAVMSLSALFVDTNALRMNKYRKR